MPDRAAAAAFIDEYRQAFETFDVGVIGARFAFPLAVVGDAGGPASVASIPSAEAWEPQLARITGAYRLLGVTGARVVGLEVVPVSPAIAQATVTWSLRTAAHAVVYEFTASYTLADTADGTRIVAIAHDESPKLAAAVAAARTGTGA